MFGSGVGGWVCVCGGGQARDSPVNLTTVLAEAGKREEAASAPLAEFVRVGIEHSQ